MTKLILILLSGVLIFITSVSSFAQKETKATQRVSKYYVSTEGVLDKALPDWVFEFEVSPDTRAHVVNGDGSAEKNVISKGLVTTDKRRSGKIIVELKVGYLARRGYDGDIAKFARYIYVQYLTSIKPRGEK